LGHLYDEGLGVAQDFVEAAKWYQRVPSGDVVYPHALVALGDHYRLGRGVLRDRDEADRLYSQAVDAALRTNLPGCTANLESESPCKELRASHARSIVRVVTFRYSWGTQAPPDLVRAARWYRKGAELGDEESQAELGELYEKGDGVAQNFQEAAKWYRAAADRGNRSAQAGLGFLYYKGDGVAEDFIEAHKWLNLAAAQGDQRARRARDTLAKLMTRQQIAEAQRRAAAWKPANKLNEPAQ
jgi:TPR repeat protein